MTLATKLNDTQWCGWSCHRPIHYRNDRCDRSWFSLHVFLQVDNFVEVLPSENFLKHVLLLIGTDATRVDFNHRARAYLIFVGRQRAVAITVTAHEDGGWVQWVERQRNTRAYASDTGTAKRRLTSIWRWWWTAAWRVWHTRDFRSVRDFIATDR